MRVRMTKLSAGPEGVWLPGSDHVVDDAEGRALIEDRAAIEIPDDAPAAPPAEKGSEGDTEFSDEPNPNAATGETSKTGEPAKTNAATEPPANVEPQPDSIPPANGPAAAIASAAGTASVPPSPGPALP